MKKIANTLLTIVFGKLSDENFDEIILLRCLVYLTLLTFTSIFINIAMHLGFLNNIIVSVTFLIFFLFYASVRIYKKTYLVKVVFSITALFFCNIMWLFNYGSRGPVLTGFVIFYSLMIFFWNNKQIFIITILLASNIIFLMYIEYEYPQFITNYPSESVRISDSYFGLLILLSLLSVLTVSAKNNYIRQYKLAQRSDKLKSAFLANMSHEIRTPLNAIIGFAKLVSTKELTKEKKEHYTKLIDDNSKYLLQLISDILDISIIESGQMKIEIQKKNLKELFERVYHTYEHLISISEKQLLKLILDIPDEIIVVETDDFRLEQIILNLLDNAIKFTNEGYIRFGFFIEDDQIIFYVEDTGIGIKEELQPEIFSRFVKHDDESSAKFIRGTGIGLSLTRELVRILGGKIWFTSQYHEGSTFYFSLPLKVLSFKHKID
jgi:signal transduction histidine kinase